jgi:PAS domain S-box-containing protein
MNDEQLRVLLRELATENGWLDIALDSMLDGIVVCDLEAVPVIYNKAAERMLAFLPGELSERPLWLSVGDRELADFLQTSFRGEDTVIDREFELEAPGGRIRVVAASLTPLVSRGRIEGSLLHLEDVTEKRKRDARLRRAESLASLTTLAAGVAHEIKNPLGSISIHIQLMRRALKKDAGALKKDAGALKKDGGALRRDAGAARGDEATGDGACLADDFERHLGVVTEEIDRLNKIVVDFLFAVRPMDVELREGDPRTPVREVAEFIKPEAEQSLVQLELRLDEEVPRVLLDHRYLKQAILNLAKNALAAMPGGGRLQMGVRQDGDEILIEIADTGVGIPEEELPKIFEPYFTTKETGTGLGLTITFKIVKEHQGEINVRSRPGEGAVFTISIPIPQRDRRLLPWKEAMAGATEASP